VKTTSFLIGPLLKSVSRSFYLTLRILPPAMREPVSLAYLLARATDTIADTKVIPLEKRRDYLRILNLSIRNQSVEPLLGNIKEDLLPHQSSEGEKILLGNLQECILLLQTQTSFDKEQIVNVLNIICSGQDLDLERFSAPPMEIPSLQTPDELQDYTYRVAGCVGEFWTKMCIHHIEDSKVWNPDETILRGIHFGQALQLTNILRDMPRDLLNGRCYLPNSQLKDIGVTPKELLNAEKFEILRPLYFQWLALAESYYDDAWTYTLQYPKRQWRMRLACAWPILIGVRTLRKLKSDTNNPLDPYHRIKVSRFNVWMILISSSLCVFSNRLFKSLYKD